MDIGKRIAQLRISRKLNQVQLANILNVSPSTIAMWETNKRALKDETIIALSDFFSVSTDYILKGKTSAISSKKTQINDVTIYANTNFTERQINDILDYVDFIKYKNNKN